MLKIIHFNVDGCHMTEKLIDELTKICGVANISEDKEKLEAFSKDSSFILGNTPQVIVWPKNKEEISKIIKLANELKIAIVPVSSSAGPRLHGDTVPKMDNTIILDLSKMNKILSIDKRNRVVMVEPGVTYEQLIPEAEKQGLRVLMPLYPRANKSVLASALEREPISTPRHHWDTSDPLLCTEVTFGTGDLFRTGMAAGPGSLEDQLEQGQAMKNPLGPTQFNMFRVLQGAQGSMGIVSWVTIKCEFLPTDLKVFYIKSDKLDFIDFLYKIMKFRMPDELFILNNVNLASLVKEESKEIEELAKKLPQFIAIYSISGRGDLAQDRIDYLEADIADIVKNFNVKLLNEIEGIPNEKIKEAFTKYSKKYWKSRLRNGFQDLFFVTTLEKVPKYIDIVKEYLKSQKFPLDNLGIYIQPQTQGSNCHLEFDLLYNPNNKEEVELTKNVFSELSIKLMDAGAFFNRPYGSWADEMYKRVDPNISVALKKVKGIFDPDNVLNPGVLCFKGGS